SQRFRDLASNRKEARKLLMWKLDDHLNGALSKRAVRISLEQKRKARSAQKNRKKRIKDGEEDTPLDVDAHDIDNISSREEEIQRIDKG
ncbi:hypothetical protein HKX48_000236, partial [Thoreauomyces humboldtii]